MESLSLKTKKKKNDGMENLLTVFQNFLKMTKFFLDFLKNYSEVLFDLHEVLPKNWREILPKITAKIKKKEFKNCFQNFLRIPFYNLLVGKFCEK